MGHKLEPIPNTNKHKLSFKLRLDEDDRVNADDYAAPVEVPVDALSHNNRAMELAKDYLSAKINDQSFSTADKLLGDARSIKCEHNPIEIRKCLVKTPTKNTPEREEDLFNKLLNEIDYTDEKASPEKNEVIEIVDSTEGEEDDLNTIDLQNT